MDYIVPLPKSLALRIAQNTHPGLALDKYAASWDPLGRDGARQERVQRPTLDKVARLSQPPATFDFAAVSARRRSVLGALRANTFCCTTTGPLTLHLARASALENAGICLHPIYGFVLLPGTGLKGMARSYAENVWKPGQTDTQAAVDTIEAVFGNEPAEPRKDRQRAGAVVFHDAWPSDWPRLTVDILNNHHSKYYQGQGDEAPGDWENPIPVYFLSAVPHTTFEFALSGRQGEADQRLMHLAREWLLGALCHFGAGAKTNSGYGAFKPAEGERPALSSPQYPTFETTLELVTPAFLAGALQEASDCDLRPATLRGLLRWWWRTLHAGYVDVPTLRAMEAAIWGNTQRGGAVQVVLEPLKTQMPLPYDKSRYASMAPHEKSSDYGIPGGDAHKTTQGLWYASFGMDEKSHGERWQRHFIPHGATWKLRVLARGIDSSIPPRLVLDQARTSLWLLARYGGIGSKSRKGFGSIEISQLGDVRLETCREAARALREAWNISSGFDSRLAASPSWEQAMAGEEVTFRWPDIWSVLDQVGFAYQSFAKSYKHRLEKKALGLPRRIGSPTSGRFQPTEPIRKIMDEPRAQRREENVRHASPIHLHVAGRSGQFVVRTVAFRAPCLPDLETSRKFLQEFLDLFIVDLKRRAALPPPPARSTSPRAPDRGGSGGGARVPSAQAPPRGVHVPTISAEDLKQRLSNLQEGTAVFKLGTAATGYYQAQKLRLAPNTPVGYQGDGGWRVVNAPAGLAEGVFVVARLREKQGEFLEVIGVYAGPPRSFPPGRGPRKR